MNEIFIDNDCKVCSAYGDWINKKNNNLKLIEILFTIYLLKTDI